MHKDSLKLGRLRWPAILIGRAADVSLSQPMLPVLLQGAQRIMGRHLAGLVLQEQRVEQEGRPSRHGGIQQLQIRGQAEGAAQG